MARPRLQLGLATALVSLAAGVAYCQAPGATADPLAQAEAAAPPVDTTVPTLETITEGTEEADGGLSAEPYAGTASATTPGATVTTDTVTSDTAPSDANEASRLKIWMSPEMVAARQYVEEYGQRSVQFNSQAATRYLDQLRRSSPLEMQAWLDRYTARRVGTARSEAVARAARQTAIDQTIARLQAVQQSYENFNAGQTAGAQIARERLVGQQALASQAGAAKQANRDELLFSQNTFAYGWIIDPPLWVKQRAAAASVPGDLPAGDPRNFLRGDVPIPGDPPGLGAGTVDPVFAPGATTGGGTVSGEGPATGGGAGGDAGGGAGGEGAGGPP